MKCSLPKVPPKVLLEPNKDFYSLCNCTNCIKLGENQQRVVCKNKTQTLLVWNLFQAGSQKLYWDFVIRISAILCGDFVKILFLFLGDFGFCDLGQSKKALT